MRRDDPAGPSCLCGARGCLEAFTSNLATLSRYMGREFSRTEARGLLRESVALSIDAVPTGIDLDAVAAFLSGLQGVAKVHDLHVWGISTTEVALTAHLVVPGGIGSDAFHARLAKDLHDRFGIEHVTVQVERGDGASCPLDGSDSVGKRAPAVPL